MTALIFDPLFLKHDTGRSHPEAPERLLAVMERLVETGLIDRLTRLPARAATRDELLAVHAPSYIGMVETLSQHGGGSLDMDTVISSDTWPAATYAAGSSAAAVAAVMEGISEDCFVLTRPPGHHAFAGRGSGFCPLNNVAVAATAARQRYGLARVAIIDWDVHHGNGTQSIVEGDAGFYYASVHQFPHYPGTGAAEDTGTAIVHPAPATSPYPSCLNIPLPPGCGDAEYERVFDELIIPAVRRYQPELILVSAGYDGHWDDPLSSMRLSASGYAAMTRRVKDLAAECCGGRLVLVLEGGYHTAALAASVAATLETLLDDAFDDPVGPPRDNALVPDISETVARLLDLHRLG
ncbi:MAG: histone deacetylase family protein [Dehalogenimonas sp.]